MSVPTIDVTPAPADEQAIASLEAAYAAPAAAAERSDAPASFGIGELFVLASFVSLAIGFLVLVSLELG